MRKSIVGIAKSSSQVEAAVGDLQESAFVPSSEISVLIPNSGAEPQVGTVKSTKAPEGATAGVVTGGVVGGTLGLLTGIGTIALPGLGAFIAAGPIMAALSGAAAGATAGGVVGAITGLGIPEYEAKTYEESLKKGGYLLAVHAEDREQSKEIRDILKAHQFEGVSSVSEK